MSSQTPTALGYRMPAEWEPHTATWLSWPRREGISFPESFDRVLPALRAMVEALIESEQVPTNEPWCRDHGPIFLTRNERWSQLAPEPRHPMRREGAPAPLAIVDWDYN